MASFYNNYYRYYRPYSANSNCHYPLKDKSIHKEEHSTQNSSKKIEHLQEEKSSRYYSFRTCTFQKSSF